MHIAWVHEWQEEEGSTDATNLASALIAQAEAAPDERWQQTLDLWLNAPAPATSNELKLRLQEFVPEYAPQLE